LKVGAGTSLPGLVAAACGAHVVLTDREDALHILENCSAIVHANNPVHFIRRQYHKQFQTIKNEKEKNMTI
jgi:hypothetical protein